MYLAIIGDLVGSRELDDRARVQRTLKKAIAELNARHAKELVADIDITGGDEFEALVRRPHTAADLVRELSAALAPVPISFGIGRGELSTALPRVRAKRRVAELDGPAFHAARDALLDARSRQAWLAIRGLPEGMDELLSSLGELMGRIRYSWTDTQRRYIAAAEGVRQKDVAERYDVSPSVVSESLKAAQFEPYRRAEKALRDALARFAS